MLIEAFGVIFILYLVYLWIYPHYLSPLRHIPDPEGLPILGHTLEFILNDDHESIHEKWLKQYEKYGMYRWRHVLYGLDVVVLTNPNWIKHVLSRPSDFSKTGFIARFFPVKDGLLASQGEKHRFQKKILLKAFATNYLKHYVSVFDRHAEVLVKLLNDLLAAKQEPSVNIEGRKYFNNLSFDIIAEVAFGYSANSQTTSASPIVVAFKDEMDVFLNLKRRAVKKYFPTAFSGQYHSKWMAVLNDVLKQRKDKIMNGTLTEFEKKDLLSIMIDGKDEKTGQVFSDHLIKDNCGTFLVAGFETTATAIPVVLYHLSMYPEMQEKCRKEIHAVMSDKHALNMDDVDGIPYTTAFIKESMRMLMTISRLGRVAQKDCKFGEYHIPKGTTLFFNSISCNRDPDVFDYSDQFIPERFLDGNSVKTGSTLSFGYGPYSCIAKNFALQEIKITILRILQHFKVTVDPEYITLKRTQFITTKFNPLIHVRFHKLNDRDMK